MKKLKNQRNFSQNITKEHNSQYFNQPALYQQIYQLQKIDEPRPDSNPANIRIIDEIYFSATKADKSLLLPSIRSHGILFSEAKEKTPNRHVEGLDSDQSGTFLLGPTDEAVAKS